jgi:predicted transcriptional regulator
MEPEMADDVMITVRVPRNLVQRARQKAQSRDETVSQVIRRSLRGYVGRTSNVGKNEDAA